MTELSEAIQRVARRFHARDLMIPEGRIVTAADEEEAARRLEEYDDFDVIPITRKGRFAAFLERKRPRPEPITIRHLIAAETPILELVESFCEHPFLFVVGRQEIVGLVHFSDLNDPIVKLPYFMLLEAVERQVSDSIRSLIDLESLQQLIPDKKRIEAIKSKMETLRAKKADRDWVTTLYLNEILRAALRFGKLSLEVSEIEALTAVRNCVAHAATSQLVEKHGDVRRLRNVERICSRLLFSSNPTEPS